MAWIRGSATSFTAVVQFAVYSEGGELLSLRCIETPGDEERLQVVSVADGWLLLLAPSAAVPPSIRALSLDGDQRRLVGILPSGLIGNPTGSALLVGARYGALVSPDADISSNIELLPWDPRALAAVWTGHDFLVAAARYAPETPEDGELVIVRVSTTGVVSPPVPVGENLPLRDANLLALWSQEGDGAVVWSEGSGPERRLHYIRLRDDGESLGPQLQVRPEHSRSGPVFGVMHGPTIFLVSGSSGDGSLGTIRIDEDDSVVQAPLTPGIGFLLPVPVEATEFGWWVARIENRYPHRLGIVRAPW